MTWIVKRSSIRRVSCGCMVPAVLYLAGHSLRSARLELTAALLGVAALLLIDYART